MKCPVCGDQDLVQRFTKQGVEVDYCTSCEGIWLDQGEIFHFTKQTRSVEDKLEKALLEPTATSRSSPVTGEPMVEISYDGALDIDYCEASSGLWFDGGELKKLLAHERSLQMTFDTKVAAHRSRRINRPASGTATKLPPIEERPSEPSAQDSTQAARTYDTEAIKRSIAAAAPEGDAAKHRKHVALPPLPLLWLRSATCLTGLYLVMLFAMLIAAEVMEIPVGVAFAVGIILVVFQFIFGPPIMDMQLRWLFDYRKVPVTAFPDTTQAFIRDVCKRHHMKIPTFGMIEDGAPQAFTYGHVPNNARIVVSSGLLELLTPEEVNAVIAHEIGHARSWDMLLMTMANLVPMLLYFLYRQSMTSQRSDARMAVAAYVLYIVSAYVVLWFSRTREYHADRFSADATRDPSLLASALVKIGYGLAAQEQPETDDEDSDEAKERQGRLEAVGAMGIMDASAARDLAVVSFREESEIGRQDIHDAMRWDLWNPWARWFELQSTHPLIAKRLNHLSQIALHRGHEPYVEFDEEQPESYWDDFALDVFVLSMIYLPFVIAGIHFAISSLVSAQPTLYLAEACFVAGIAGVFHYRFT